MSNGSRGNSKEPEAKEGKSDEIFEVEKILAHKVTDNELLLKVRWLGYGGDEDTWEPESDLRECAGEVVQEYYKQLKVNDKTELIEALQKKIKQSKSQKKKKRDRAPSDGEDEGAESDGSFSTPKSKKSKKSAKSTPSSTAKNSAKVPTKAALKSYEDTLAGPVAPNNAKKAAKEVRDRRNWLEDDNSSDDDTPAPAETEIEKIASKVKGKAPPEPSEPKIPPKKEEKLVASSPAPKPSASVAISTPNNNQNGTAESSSSQKPKVNKTPNAKKEADVFDTQWTIDGITLHTDDNYDRKKIVLMTHKTTGDRKVVDAKEAFTLGGWALTKYLLDRCQF